MSNMQSLRAEQRVATVVNQQGWNKEVEVHHLESFLRAKGLMAEYADYLEAVAQEENEAVA